MTKKKSFYKFAIALLVLSMNMQTSISYAQSPQKGRCTATTQQGSRCKNDAIRNGRCHVHQIIDEKNKCKATTQSGNRCSREAKTEGYCTQHYNMWKKGKLKKR